MKFLGQMFGRLDVATNDWTDGIFSALWRKTLKAKKGEHIWLVLDGPVDPLWIENLNSVLDDNKTLTLANGDRLPMMANCKLIFEPKDIDNASPATVSRNGMVYMSSSGLDWSPLYASWVKKKKVPPEDAGKIRRLFEDNFTELFKWCWVNLDMVMDVIQINISSQIFSMLEGLLPSMQLSDDEKAPVIEKKEVRRIVKEEDSDDEDMDPEKIALKEKKKKEEEEKMDKLQTNHEQIYIFCLLWSMGAFLESGDRTKFETYLTKHTKLKMPRIPDGDSIFNYNVNVHTGEWSHWNDLISDYQPPEITPQVYSTLLIPNVSSIRTEFLINLVARNGFAVLLMGEQGSAKTTMINSHLKNYSSETHVVSPLIKSRVNFLATLDATLFF